MCTLKTESKLRFMDAGRESTCHYCDELIKEGAAIAGDYGILWGHQACVIGAWQEKRLILSSNNADRRKPELELSANRRYNHGSHEVQRLTAGEKHARGSGMVERMKSLQELERVIQEKGITILPPAKDLKELDRMKATKLKSSETQLRRPTSCSHFPPQLIQLVTMPRSMRPADYVIKEFDPEPETLKQILERMWKDYLEKRFREWKRKQKELPACSYHQWEPGVDLEVVTVDLEPDGFKWKRALWWRCPGCG